MLRNLDATNPFIHFEVAMIRPGDMVEDNTGTFFVTSVRQIGNKTDLSILTYDKLLAICKQDELLTRLIGSDLLRHPESWKLKNRIASWHSDIMKHILETYGEQGIKKMLPV